MTQEHLDRLDAEQAQADARRESVDALKGWLDTQHRKALEEDPYGRFVSRLPVEEIAKLTPQEQEQIAAAEEQSFERHKPVAQEKAAQKTAYLLAGGNEADFERTWSEYGREVAVQGLAGELEARAHEDNVF